MTDGGQLCRRCKLKQMLLIAGGHVTIQRYVFWLLKRNPDVSKGRKLSNFRLVVHSGDYPFRDFCHSD
jgi:hypothetical protein